MDPIKDLCHHKRPQFWFGFGRPKKSKKQRHPRHTVLKFCLPVSALLCLIKLCPLVLNWLNHDLLLLLSHPSNDGLRFRLRAILGVQVSSMVVAALQAWNFLVFWHRKNNGIRRSISVVVGDLLLIILSAFNVFLVKPLRTAAPKAEDLLQTFSDLETDDRAKSLERTLIKVLPLRSRFLIFAVLIDVATHASAIAFWHWLLPPRWRFPNHYEPLVREKKKESNILSIADGVGVQLELIGRPPTEPPDSQTSLAAHFLEQERQKSRENIKQSAEVGTKVSKAMKLHS